MLNIYIHTGMLISP